MSDPPRDASSVTPRITPVEREAVIARLSSAFAEDVLPVEEFEHRVAAVYQAASRHDLSALVADLPATVPDAVARPGTSESVTLATVPQRIDAIFGSVEREGRVRVPRRFEIRSIFGNVELDLSDAHFAPGLTEIEVLAVFGNIELELPDHVVVENHGNGMLATFSVRGRGKSPRGRVGPDAPVVRITGKAVLGNVEIEIESRSRRRDVRDWGDDDD
jgi:hypothetical protein